ncbi:MAG TPA: XRE family transcriptional regulator [Acidimicrobiales bacterium]|nr:XRE family transcriptional regulator [Acidimicrobiales bacterium]
MASTEKRARSAAPITALSQHLASNERVAPALVGARIRTRRLQRGISLRQFARDLEVSASFISQLETGKASPSVATLFAICAALDLSTDELFDNDATVNELGANGTEGATDASNNPWRSSSSFGTLAKELPAHSERPAANGSPLVHPHERRVLVLDSGVTWESLTATRSEKTDFMFVRYDVGGSSTMEGRLIRHVGTEYGFILSGTLEVTVGFDTYRLVSGDSISFDSSRPHRLANVGDVPVEALWFNLEFSDHA